MTLFEMIGATLIAPLKLLFEIIFSVAYQIIRHPGPAIVVLSVAMNILVLPLYRRADEIQMEARDTENKLRDVVSHIKKTFSGDERMMILQTYYRQNNYNPLSVLSGSVSLLLEIPFFMAAYQFLSGVEAFQGVAFGPISDLSMQDGLLLIGGIKINLLPILMTVVNVISSSLYLKGFPLKTKIQLYGMALFFLVFLYNSPSALVLYWTLNNVFSLVKTLFYKIKNSRRVLDVITALLGGVLIVLGIKITGTWKTILLIGIGIAAQSFWVMSWLEAKLPPKASSAEIVPNKTVFVLGGLFLSILTGLLIPSTFISASVQEFVDIGAFFNPVWYVVYTYCIAVGTFLVWFGVFYWLANPAGKVFFSRLVWILSGVMLINYMFFGTNLGVLSPNLYYVDGFGFTTVEIIINIAVVVILGATLYLVSKKFSRGLSTILLIGAIALTSMSVINMIQITKVAKETEQQINNSDNQIPTFSLSKNGNNVVVIMMDRAIGPFVPYILEENPILAEKLDGFTYYGNTLSYGGFTNFATPALYGGYDYTPVNMNRRDSELLVDKHNEALKVMPSLFAEEDYDVTLIDPSYANYQWIPDISIFDDMEGVKAYRTAGLFDTPHNQLQTIASRKRNFFLFSLMKTMPLALQSPIYNNGNYYEVKGNGDTVGNGHLGFMPAYNIVLSLSSMTNISEIEDTLLIMRSDLTHEPTVLQEPNFIPVSIVDNSQFYSAEGKMITDGDSTYLLDSEYLISHYHTNVAALMRLGDWFDYLREKGVYDNTRIILVSDHGRDLQLFDDGEGMHDLDFYMPLLMVKDFNAKGFHTSDEFMTNADVPTLATAGLIENPVNPFTGNPVDSSYKLENDEQYVLVSEHYDVNINNGYQFIADEWATVSGDVRDKASWKIHTTESLFPPELADAQ